VIASFLDVWNPAVLLKGGPGRVLILVSLSLSLHESPELASVRMAHWAVPAWCSPRLGCYSSSV